MNKLSLERFRRVAKDFGKPIMLGVVLGNQCGSIFKDMYEARAMGQARQEVLESSDELDEVRYNFMEDLVDREERLRPFVKQLIDASDTGEVGIKGEPSKAEKKAELDEAAARLRQYLENGQIRLGTRNDAQFGGEFVDFYSESQSDELLLVNRDLGMANAGTLMHETLHREYDHKEDLDISNAQAVEHWRAGKELGSIVREQQDTPYEASILYEVVERPFVHMKNGILRNPDTQDELLTWSAEVSSETFADTWAGLVSENNNAYEAFGITREEVQALYASEAFFETYQEMMQEFANEHHYEYKREVKGEKMAETRAEQGRLAKR